MKPSKATAEQITFYSYWLPALAPGQYSVSVTQVLQAAVTKEKATTTEDLASSPVTETFHVGAPRYALTGSEAYSCYPAPGQIGQFYGTLPHIVFDRCTLPWERTIGTDATDGTDPTVPHDPWLALILLTDADFSSETDIDKKRVPPIVPGTLAKVLFPEANVIGPKIQSDPYDLYTDPCQTIDLPARVFKAVMPRTADLPYLAHVREVKTDNKETWSLLKEGKFSVVVCNRFPETQEKKGSGEKDWGIVNTVCLVSLEGWAAYLDNPDKVGEGNSCRLLVLGSWRFTCQGSSAFKSLMKHLNDDDKDNRLLGLPPLKADETAPQDAKGFDYVDEALKMGFAPVNHDLRNSDTTISWYRGPLVPVYYGISMSYTDISCADAALRYNPETGMFDASYAAAWQLGRLLALQDQAFAQALFRLRTEFQRWVRMTNTQALKEKDKATKLQGNLSGERSDKPNNRPSNIRDWYTDTLAGAGYLGGTGNVASVENEPDAPLIPSTVQNWLGQAMLLYGVPFQYLVPDEEMLPAESIRFFYLNPEWLNCLLQGACSVGRTSETDELADQLLRARFFEVSEKLALELRSSAKQAADEGRGGAVSPRPAEQRAVRPAEQRAVLHWPLSGYLLRSAAVESWIGLEAKATGVDSTGMALDPLQILRMDRLAPDILLCIYNGKVTEIEVKQPPEAIHFGAEMRDEGYEKTGLRNIKDDDVCKGTAVPMRGRRVVDVTTLATNIKDVLVSAKQLEPKDSFTSAEFALEMIAAPAKVTFTGSKG